MKRLLAASVLALSGIATAASAGPVTMTNSQMDEVRAGAITELRTNPAGNPTQGQGNAITVTNVNPQGKAPPGHN